MPAVTMYPGKMAEPLVPIVPGLEGYPGVSYPGCHGYPGVARRSA